MKLLFLADGSVDFCHRLQIRDQNIYLMVEIMKKLTRDIRNCNFQKKFEGEARPIGPNVKDFSLN